MRRRKPKPPFYGAKVRCLLCGDTLQSTHVHDYRACTCGRVAIDGGAEYCKMTVHMHDDCFPPYEIIDPGNYRYGE